MGEPIRLELDHKPSGGEVRLFRQSGFPRENKEAMAALKTWMDKYDTDKQRVDKAFNPKGLVDKALSGIRKTLLEYEMEGALPQEGETGSADQLKQSLLAAGYVEVSVNATRATFSAHPDAVKHPDGFVDISHN